MLSSIVLLSLGKLFQGPTITAEKRTAPEQIGRYQWGAATIPVQGSGESFLNAFDQTMTDYLREVGAPGGALSVYYKGKLVYSKGFGWADIDGKIPFTAKTPHRISSLSKFLTKELIESLIEDGSLESDSKVVDILRKGGISPLVPPGRKPDPRLGKITIQHLLDHKSGIQSGLNMMDCMSDTVIREMRFSTPIRQNDALGYILGLPLDADPGERDNYSNFGYALLGKVIEVITGKSYESAVKEKALGSLVDSSRWFVTTANRKDRREKEATYYTTRSLQTWDQYRLDICAGAAGWVAPTEDIANYFQHRFPGNGWQYTLFGSYTGAVTVMRVEPNSLVFAANVNYRRGIGPSDNDVLFNKLETTAKGLKLP